MFALTLEVGIEGSQHTGSGPGAPPGPRPAYPSAGWGGSDRTPPSLVWGYTLEIIALKERKEAAERKVIFIFPAPSQWPLCCINVNMNQ